MVSIEECKGEEAILDQVRADDAARNHLFIGTVSSLAQTSRSSLIELRSRSMRGPKLQLFLRTWRAMV